MALPVTNQVLRSMMPPNPSIERTSCPPLMSNVRRRMRNLLLIFGMLYSSAVLPGEPVCTPKWLDQLQATTCGLASEYECQGLMLREADKELNVAYRDLLSDLIKPEPLTQSQRAWLRFRTAECDYQGSGMSCGGNTSKQCWMARDSCIVRLTCERVLQLRAHSVAHCNGCPMKKSESTEANRP